MPVEVFVDVVDHRRQRRRLARTGRPGDQENPARAAADLLGHLRQADLLERQNFVGDSPQHQRAISLLLENRHAEARFFAVGKPEVARTGLFIFLLNALGRDRLHERNGVFRLQHLCLKLAQMPMHAQSRRLANGEMKVRRTAADGGFQKTIDL